MLLWKCLEEIPKFLPYIMKNCDVCELVVPICYFMIESRKDISKVGLCYLCTFLLLKMSGERNFGVGLNKPYNLYLPIDIPAFTGNHADLVIICLHKMIVSGRIIFFLALFISVLIFSFFLSLFIDLFLLLFIGIYIYICVCMCVCVLF